MAAVSRGRSRRDFFRIAGAIAAAAGCGETQVNARESEGPHIGILLATTFTTGTLEERLDAAKANGLACVQMSMACANLPEMPDVIPADLPGRIRRGAAARGIAIASLTGTFNMTHPDPAYRRTGLRRLRVLAESCSDMGTSFIHVCTGTRDPNSMWRYHPDNALPESWRDMAASMREATEIARQANVVLAFEPEMSNVVDSARKARRLLDEIGSPHLKVTMDPRTCSMPANCRACERFSMRLFRSWAATSCCVTRRISTTTERLATNPRAKACSTTTGTWSCYASMTSRVRCCSTD